jgi:hypothetical protein
MGQKADLSLILCGVNRLYIKNVRVDAALVVV